MKRRDWEFEVYGVTRCGRLDCIGLEDTVLWTHDSFSIRGVGMGFGWPTIDRTLQLRQRFRNGWVLG